MNKKLIVSLVLISIFCLTIVSALNVKEAFDNVVSNPLGNLITGDAWNVPTTTITATAPSTAGVSTVNELVPITGCRLQEINPNTGIATDLTEDCKLMYDGIEGSGVTLQYKSKVQAIFYFDTTYVKEVQIRPGLNFNNAKIQYGADFEVPLSTLLSDTWKTLTVDKPNINFIRITWEPQGFETGLYEFKVFSATASTPVTQPTTSGCTDSDTGRMPFIKGEVTDTTGTTQGDKCWFVAYNPDRKRHAGWYDNSNLCKTGTPIVGGYIDRCDIEETTCDGTGLIKKELITCLTGACYDGRCVCEHDSDCMAGYKCLWDQGVRVSLCESVEEQEDIIIGCLLDGQYYPKGTIKVINDKSKYCHFSENNMYSWLEQKTLNSDCINNWECETGFCLQGSCASFSGSAQCVGYQSNDICLPLGTRKEGKFIGVAAGVYNLIDQKAEDASCENNYECLSNACIDGVCTKIKQDTGLLHSIWCFVTLGQGEGC